MFHDKAAGTVQWWCDGWMTHGSAGNATLGARSAGRPASELEPKQEQHRRARSAPTVSNKVNCGTGICPATLICTTS